MYSLKSIFALSLLTTLTFQAQALTPSADIYELKQRFVSATEPLDVRRLLETRTAKLHCVVVAIRANYKRAGLVGDRHMEKLKSLDYSEIRNGAYLVSFYQRRAVIGGEAHEGTSDRGPLFPGSPSTPVSSSKTLNVLLTSSMTSGNQVGDLVLIDSLFTDSYWAGQDFVRLERVTQKISRTEWTSTLRGPNPQTLSVRQGKDYIYIRVAGQQQIAKVRPTFPSENSLSDSLFIKTAPTTVETYGYCY